MIMMNRIILIFILILVGVLEAFSNPVDTEVAQNFMSKSHNTSKIIADVVTEKFEGQNVFYVVNYSVQISVANLNTGTYIVCATSEGKTESKQLFICHLENRKSNIIS